VVSYHLKMKQILLILLILLSVGIFTKTAVTKEVDEPSSIAHLVEQAKLAFTNKNETETDRILGIIYTKTTGLPVDAKMPSGMDIIDFEQRQCQYRKAIEPLMTSDTLNHLRHSSRLTAMSFVDFGDEKGLEIEVLLNCVQDDGVPVIENKALRDAIAWLKAFKTGSENDVLKMVQEYDDLYKKHPSNIMYKALYLHARRKAEERGIP